MAGKKTPTTKGNAKTTGAANKTTARARTAKKGKQEQEEKRLKQSLSLLKATLQSTADGILVVAGDGRIADFNEQFAELWGLPKTILDLHDDQKALDFVLDQLKNPEQFIAKVRELYAQPEATSFDVLEFKDGRIFERYSQPQRIDGTPVGRVWSFRDVTKRKKAEEALHATNERLKFLLKSTSVAIYTSKTSGDYGATSITENVKQITGYEPQAFIDNAIFWIEHVHHEDRQRIVNELPRLFEQGTYSYEYRFLHKDGTYRWINDEMRLIKNEVGNPLEIIGYWMDITERRKLEDARMFLVECGTKGDDFFESLAQYLAKSIGMDYVCIDRLEGDLLTAKTVAVYFDGKFDDNVSYTLHDTPCGEVVGRDVCFFPKGVRHRFPKDAVLQDMKAESYIGVTLWSHMHQPIGLIAVIGRRPLEDPGLAESVLKLAAIRAAAELERKFAEEQIRQSEQFIRNILDTVDEGFIVIDRDYRIVTANKSYCSQIALPCDDVIGRHCHEISHKAARPCYEEGEECAVRLVFSNGEPHTVVHKHIDHDGHNLFVETKAYPIKDASGSITSVIETISNITEKHLLEEERLKTQKLESIGTLAGGIAHDFNNLLQGIFGYISMAKMTLDQKEKSLAMLEQAEKALHQSVNLTTQLLTFSKGGKPVKKSLSLLPVIENAARFALSGSRSEYRTSSAPDLWRVEADEGQLGQVIQNIVLNADQAMPLGGCVEIAAQNVSASDASLPRSIAGKDHVLITIRDSGVGIPEQYLGKIFDPYFTTKEKGSGLGLATSYSIMRNHGGLIDVRSQVGKGTAFFLYLPASAAAAEESQAAAAPVKARTGRVLVMDDEKVVREVTGEILRALGHEAAFAESGEEALTMYREAMASARPFDVVILDLTIRGGMGGLETVGKLLELDPGAKAIVSSGYSDDAALSSYREQGFRAFLKKPYNLKELQNTLSDMLG